MTTAEMKPQVFFPHLFGSVCVFPLQCLGQSLNSHIECLHGASYFHKSYLACVSMEGYTVQPGISRLTEAPRSTQELKQCVDSGVACGRTHTAWMQKAQRSPQNSAHPPASSLCLTTSDTAFHWLHASCVCVCECTYLFMSTCVSINKHTLPHTHTCNKQALFYAIISTPFYPCHLYGCLESCAKAVLHGNKFS